MVLNPPDGVCNTPMSDSYTWSAAERVVGQKTSPRVCNMRHQMQLFLAKGESENGFVRAVRVAPSVIPGWDHSKQYFFLSVQSA